MTSTNSTQMTPYRARRAARMIEKSNNQCNSSSNGYDTTVTPSLRTVTPSNCQSLVTEAVNNRHDMSLKMLTPIDQTLQAGRITNPNSPESSRQLTIEAARYRSIILTSPSETIAHSTKTKHIVSSMTSPTSARLFRRCHMKSAKRRGSPKSNSRSFRTMTTTLKPSDNASTRSTRTMSAITTTTISTTSAMRQCEGSDKTTWCLLHRGVSEVPVVHQQSEQEARWNCQDRQGVRGTGKYESELRERWCHARRNWSRIVRMRWTPIIEVNGHHYWSQFTCQSWWWDHTIRTEPNEDVDRAIDTTQEALLEVRCEDESVHVWVQSAEGGTRAFTTETRINRKQWASLRLRAILKHWLRAILKHWLRALVKHWLRALVKHWHTTTLIDRSAREICSEWCVCIIRI